MLFTEESLEKEEWLPHLPSFQPSAVDPMLQEPLIELNELTVVNGLPTLKHFMGLRGDISKYVTTTQSSDSKATLTLANTLNDLVDDLLEIEKISLAEQLVNMPIQGDGITQRSGVDNYRGQITKAKADIQRQMHRSANSKAGYIIWLDYKSDPSWDPFARPRILPQLPPNGDHKNDAYKAVVESARTIASVSTAMLARLKANNISKGLDSEFASSIQEITSDYSTKVLHPKEVQWYEERKTFEDVLSKSR